MVSLERSESGQGNSKIKTTKISKGNKIDATTISDSAITSEDDILYVGHPGIAVWKQAGVVRLLDLGSMSISTIDQGGYPEARVEIHASLGEKSFLVSTETAMASSANLWTLDKHGSFSIKHEINGTSEFPTSWSTNVAPNGEQYFIWSKPSGKSEIYSTSAKKPVFTFKGRGEADQLSPPVVSISEVIPKADSTFALRTFLMTESGDTHLIRNSDLQWTRLESLSGLKSAVWVELLDPAIEEVGEDIHVEETKNVLGAYIHRVKRHTHEFITYGPAWFMALPSRVKAEFTGAELPVAQEGGRLRDSFGFTKLLVGVTTDVGGTPGNNGMVALNAGQEGKVVWKRSDVPGQGQEVKGLYEIGKGMVGVVTSSGRYFVLDALKGYVLQEGQIEASTRILTTALTVVSDTMKAILVLYQNVETGAQEVQLLGTANSKLQKEVYLVSADEQGGLQGLKVIPEVCQYIEIRDCALAFC